MIIGNAIDWLRLLAEAHPDDIHFAIDLANAYLAKASIHHQARETGKRNDQLELAMASLRDLTGRTKNPAVIATFTKAAALRGGPFVSRENEEFLARIGYDRRTFLAGPGFDPKSVDIDAAQPR
jgi:hypothetical protein